MLYELTRPFLFRLDPEMAHLVTVLGLKAATLTGVAHMMPKPTPKPVRCMGLDFPNPVGLAAGLDKSGAYIDGFAALGFGFLEIGTITPRAQPGNPKPRLFRLPQAQAVINRMGFNNDGMHAAVRNITRSRYTGILGMNIGKNFDTPLEHAARDYVACLNHLYAYASYITINISSPNTQGLRSLQSGEAFIQLLSTMKNRQSQLSSQHQKYVPIVFKISPDIDGHDIDFMSEQLLAFEIDGLIATNTTISRPSLAADALALEQGGLSGRPLKSLSDSMLRAFYARLGQRIPIIGVGGITDAQDVRDKQNCGAALVQLYTGLVYQGPQLIKQCVSAWG